MKISLRLTLAIIAGVATIAFVFAYFQVRIEKQTLRRELERRAEVLAESLEEAVTARLESGSPEEVLRVAERFGNRERVAGVAVYGADGGLVAVTSGLRDLLSEPPGALARALSSSSESGEYLTLGATPMHVHVRPLMGETGALAVFHDTRYIEIQESRIWRDTFVRLLVQTLLIVLLTLLVVRWSLEGPIAKTVEWMRELRRGGEVERLALPDEDIFRPLTKEVTNLARSLATARAAAEEEARLREAAESLWTRERLRIHVQNKLGDSSLFVVSNREPCMHVHRGNAIEAMVPASGLVTALQPILRACDGTWIAHGGGDADRETVDANDRLRVPPENPQYTLRRVWLTKDEEEGYYFGFSNEGLWPLCHIAHTRPLFRASDWEHYQQVNRKFARTVLEEMQGTERPFVLAQDYHFALLPRLVKDQRPDARVAIFWHIPWPNPEAFGICPWQRELVDGLLGADLVGFHIQSHCTNFLETVDRTVECRIEWERYAVNRRGHFTLVRPFPVSVDLQELPPGMESESPYLLRAELFKDLGVTATFMGVGVDRVDYTKGILERFRGVERFLEKYPIYQGQFTFVQIGAPSRTHLKRYHDLLAEVESEADRINWRFQAGSWKPIVFLKRHHTHEEIERYYRAADLCLVTSLHDGMNLVAKEYVAARHDVQGALIISRFAGASRELRDALIVNPYDTEQLADALRYALEMDPEERRARMERMRQRIRDHNIYRWAADFISELSEVRPEKHRALPPESERRKASA